MRARGWLLVVVVLGSGSAGMAACGLGEGGQLVVDGSVSDVAVADGPKDVVADVPQACTTLDASACVDAALPSGWTWAMGAPADLPCPFTDLVNRTVYIRDPQPAAGACACTCNGSGAFSCAGTITFKGTGGCNSSSTFDAGDTDACVAVPGQWNDHHFSFGQLPNPSGAASCAPMQTIDPTTTSTPATICTPGCSVDYCGIDAGFRKCIQQAGNQTCPAPWSFGATVGPDSGVTVTCSACDCALDPAVCTATVTAYANNDCTGMSGSVTPGAACNQPFNGNPLSFSYVPVDPTPTCSVVDAGVATAQITSAPITVCCLP